MDWIQFNDCICEHSGDIGVCLKAAQLVYRADEKRVSEDPATLR